MACNADLALDTVRLRLAGSNGYPGTDELKHYAAVLGGQIEMMDLDNMDGPLVTYGEGGPLLYCVGHQNTVGADGHAAEHWVLVRTYMKKRALHTIQNLLIPSPMPLPKPGDSIMVLQKKWLDMILSNG